MTGPSDDAAAHLAEHFGLEGPNYSCLTACAAGSQAIGEAADLIKEEESDPQEMIDEIESLVGELENVKEELSAIKPWPGVFDRSYVRRLEGTHVKSAPTKRHLADLLIEDIEAFRSAQRVDRAVMLWCGSTEVYLQPSATHQTLAAFEKGLEKNAPEITPSMIPSVSQYAGQELTTGAQAAVYANDFIGVHIKAIGGGYTYSQLSAQAMAMNPNSKAGIAKAAQVETVFKGTTLRAMLLEAYGFSVFGTIAQDAAIAAFMLAALMVLLVGFGFYHARRTSMAVELAFHTKTTKVGSMATA